MLTELKNAAGERIDFTYHHGRQGAGEIVVIGHGVTGNKDRPFIVALAEGLAKVGIPAVRFSFSGNGTSAGKFSESTISKEVEDLGSVLDKIKDQRVCYVGHSMGGAVGVIRAAKDPRIQALVSLAGMVHTAEFARREFGTVKPGEGFMWDDCNCPLSAAYMEDLAQIGSVADLASQIRVPWLLVHGTEDDVVPIDESREIYARANPPKDFVEMKGANHVFGGEHTASMVTQVANWVSKTFNLAR